MRCPTQSDFLSRYVELFVPESFADFIAERDEKTFTFQLVQQAVDENDATVRCGRRIFLLGLRPINYGLTLMLGMPCSSIKWAPATA